MAVKSIEKNLNNLYTDSPVKKLTPADRVVIFSDIHVGDGGRNDDFRHNEAFFMHLVEKYYKKNNFHLILNGDVEDLYKFPQKVIHKQYEGFYKMLEWFRDNSGLTKLVGNHDYSLSGGGWHNKTDIPVQEVVKLRWKGDDILIFHGHQAGGFSNFLNFISTFVMRFFANPLGIGNYSVAHDSGRKYRVERRVYNFARERKILAVIGHTHRALFESMSRVDSLKYRIEKYCRIYPRVGAERKEKLGKKIKRYKDELQGLIKRQGNKRGNKTLYSSDPTAPCMFNSGSCIGRNGVTSIEIDRGVIQLVYWFDKNRSEKYFDFNGYKPEQLEDSDTYRVTLNKETLDYVFTKVKLLS